MARDVLLCVTTSNRGTPIAQAMAEPHSTAQGTIAHLRADDIERSIYPMINFIIWLLFGALVGWLASIVMRTDAQQGALMNIIVGIVGAFLGGFLASALGFSGSNINNNDFSLSGLVVAFIGAVVLLGIVNLVRRGSVR